MTSHLEKAELAAKILLHFESGDIEKVVEIVKRHWIVFPDLAERMRDDEAIAFAAVSSAMQIGYSMSERLRRDISFFVRAFDAHNAYRKIGTVSIASPRDLFFILLFARSCCHYSHLIGEAEVAELFGQCTVEGEATAATEFKELIDSHNSWPNIGPRTKDIYMCYFKSKAPGFADSSYQYANQWLSRNLTFDAVFG